ncbi:P-loop containing nucleoside triphosphate hydrolase protein [Trematosphaeria pertusa]|uniref:P-loop containing nucleoside triphosphate hydrolase protein n=1 Tax=Trematosphaeria pertusa TaxID=390896 RepID=A0A6A6IL71_9PLEO|nr:P-loop containing nucleoside triphosphate hydrolase protein [Trematosphaeria pertusa]KAF2250592.1 P-loop containing nucleoside triphosphate hydrolase protein [Trematosphaeria pertusa]
MTEKDKVNTDKSETSNEEVGKTCELRVRQQRFDRSGNAEDVVVDSLKLPRGHGFDKPYAVVVNQIFTEKNLLDKEIATINSEHILEAFREVIGSYPTVAADFSEPFDMESPFQMLFHFWHELDAYKEAVEDDVARMHMNLLFDFMEITMGPEKKRVETQIKKGQIDFSRAWTLYRPGDIQIKFEHDHPWLLKCVKTAYEENTRQGKWIEVHCTHTDFDGRHVGEATLITKIHQKQFFASENPANIKDLLVYPRKYYNEGESLERRLTERGDRFLALTETCVRQYDGLAEHIKEPPYSFWDPDMALFDPVWITYKETGRIMVDRKTFQEDKNLTRVAIPASQEDVDKILCPPFVYGFSLAIKEWCRFYLEYIRDVQWNKGCMDALVMKEEQKSLLQAMVSSHDFPENPRDQTKQKGKGLVVLLHGSPGTGKTLTAECCAEITGRALFSTSLAELNKENFAWYFERRLVTVLQYATIWRACVLLDEADVFLEQRRDDVADSSERNGLVAVFLRHLEYFSGIVFLTTNRIHVFDEAMKSRIHLALGYNPPELEMRRMLWTKSLKTATGGELEAEVEEAIDVFIRTNLNGREISNTINTAQTLARFEGGRLHLKHIEQVLNVRKEFEMGLRKMIKDAKRTSTGPIARRGSMLGTMCEEPEELEG